MAGQEKIYVGSGIEKVFDDGGSIVNVMVCLSDIPKEHITEKDNKRWVNLTVAKRRTPSERGASHYVTINTYRAPADSDRQDRPPPAAAPQEQGEIADAEDTLGGAMPF